MGNANRCAGIRRRDSLPAKTFVLVGLSMAAALCLVITPQEAYAQKSYSDYYQKTLRQTAGGLGTASSNRYLYDKYFYKSPTVSPYLNLGRGDTLSGTSYQAYVRPELQRREAAMKKQSAYIQQRKLQGNVGHTQYPGAGFIGGTPGDAWLKPAPARKATPSAYYNHWYGSWAGR